MLELGLQIALGDARSYYVTTARNDLGVIFANSESGESFASIGELGLNLLIMQARPWNQFHGRRCAVRKRESSRKGNAQNQKDYEVVEVVLLSLMQL